MTHLKNQKLSQVISLKKKIKKRPLFNKRKTVFLLSGKPFKKQSKTLKTKINFFNVVYNLIQKNQLISEQTQQRRNKLFNIDSNQVQDIKEKSNSFFLISNVLYFQAWKQEKLKKKPSKKQAKKIIKDRFNKIKRKQKRMRFLRHILLSPISDLIFQPWKKVKLPLTKKKKWLGLNYNRYQKLRIKDKIDFFRTSLGQTLISAEMHAQPDYKNSWVSKNRVLGYNNEDEHMYHKTRSSKEQMKLQLAIVQKNAWWYDNLIQKQRQSLSERKFRLDRPNTAFQLHWKQQKKEPWKDSLLFRRALYEGFGERLRKENKFRLLKIKPYLRRKNPRHEKRNRLYNRNHILLTNLRLRFRIRAKKAARIKQIAGKILRPFYGNLRKKQMNKLLKKSRRQKSKFVTSNETILNRFENRLDVIIYRLNLAPTILWARRLIQGGLVFIQTNQKVKNWTSMYSYIKKLAFPLKLRDPYHLYSKKLWIHSSNQWTKFKFLGQPKRKVSYLVQPGDLIQCATGFLLNQFKTKSWLWQKPIPSYLMTHKKRKACWYWYPQKYAYSAFNHWEQHAETTTSAMMLHKPQFRDLNLKDRVDESFLRWAVL